MAVDRESYNSETMDIGDLAAMAAVHTVLSLVDTVKIGRITAFDASTQRADVELLQLVPYEDGEGSTVWEQEEDLDDIPVLFPGSGSRYSVAWPISAGDFVLLLINERSLDDYKATGALTQQTDPRRWNEQDAIAIPLRDMRTPVTLPESDAMAIQAPEVRLVSSSASASISRDPDVQANLSDIEATVTALRTFQTTFITALTAAETAANAAVPGFGTAVFLPMKQTLNAVSVPGYSPTATAVEEVLVP